jgi:hypothetical protein
MATRRSRLRGGLHDRESRLDGAAPKADHRKHATITANFVQRPANNTLGYCERLRQVFTTRGIHPIPNAAPRILRKNRRSESAKTIGRHDDGHG